MKVEDVIKYLVLQDQIKDFEYDEVTTNFVSLPRTSVKICSDSWTKSTARKSLKKYMKTRSQVPGPKSQSQSLDNFQLGKRNVTSGQGK